QINERAPVTRSPDVDRESPILATYIAKRARINKIARLEPLERGFGLAGCSCPAFRVPRSPRSRSRTCCTSSRASPACARIPAFALRAALGSRGQAPPCCAGRTDIVLNVKQIALKMEG